MSENLDQTFLRAQLEQFEDKLARLQDARDNSDDELEAKGVEGTLRTAQHLFRLLQDLLIQQSDEDAPSLDTVIEQQIRTVQRQLNQASQGWHKGQPVPAEYWDAQNQQSFLIELRQHYHQWIDPVTQEVDKSKPDCLSPGNPWGVSHGVSNHLTADEILERINHMLFTKELPQDHLHIVVAQEETIAVTGIVHDKADVERVSMAILALDVVHEVLLDIQTIPEDRCPICRA